MEGKPLEDATSSAQAAQAFTPAEAKPLQRRERSVSDEPPFRIPPATAIAGVLIRDWVDGKLSFSEERIKQNL